ncbi:hypothetical protein BH10PSE4_BH10PSE4_44540 [soil metagenome]
MSTIRPTGLPSVPPRPAQGSTGAGGSRAAAFFQAAVAEAAPTRAAVPPIAIQLQTQAQPQRQPPARPFVQPAEQPQKLLRPGSLLNILV